MLALSWEGRPKSHCFQQTPSSSQTASLLCVAVLRATQALKIPVAFAVLCCRALLRHNVGEQIGEPELARLSVFQRRFLRLQFLVCQRQLLVIRQDQQRTSIELNQQDIRDWHELDEQPITTQTLQMEDRHGDLGRPQTGHESSC